MRLFIALSVLLLLCGCQSVTKIQYYQPTEANKQFCVPTANGVQGHGPIKIIEGKSGAPDFSDSKSFKFNLSILGL